MAREPKRPPQTMRNISPCKDCTEKFEACHGRCPKDKRGEYGYNEWLADRDKVKAAREEFIKKISIRKRW